MRGGERLKNDISVETVVQKKFLGIRRTILRPVKIVMKEIGHRLGKVSQKEGLDFMMIEK